MRAARELSVLFALTALAPALEVPLEFHGRGMIGKYLNSTTRYNMDASLELRCSVVQAGAWGGYLFYRDDLDMAEQQGGVSLDPRYAHYYIAAGVDYRGTVFYGEGYFMHDCVHDIDYQVEGTPVFNRVRVRFGTADANYAQRAVTRERLIPSLELGWYPHWRYHGWDINDGADYQVDAALAVEGRLVAADPWSVAFVPRFMICRGDTCYYHQHQFALRAYFNNAQRRIGAEVMYHLKNTDPIKDPDKRWLASLFIDF